MGAAFKVDARVDPATGQASLAGKPLFAGTQDELADKLAIAATAPASTLVITPNVDQALLLQRDAAWRTAFAHGDIFIADGMPVVALARLLGARGLRRLTGSDLLPAMVARSARDGFGVAIVGGSDESRGLAVRNLVRAHPGARVLGVALPYLTSPDDPAGLPAVRQLVDARPGVVFLCLGSPKQELWYLAWRRRLPPAVYVGAGAAVDFAAGTLSRAPAWMQRLSLEWLYRLAREPRRLARRYLLRGPGWLLVMGRSLARRARGQT